MTLMGCYQRKEVTQAWGSLTGIAVWYMDEESKGAGGVLVCLPSMPQAVISISVQPRVLLKTLAHGCSSGMS